LFLTENRDRLANQAEYGKAEQSAQGTTWQSWAHHGNLEAEQEGRAEQMEMEPTHQPGVALRGNSRREATPIRKLFYRVLENSHCSRYGRETPPKFGHDTPLRVASYHGTEKQTQVHI